MNKKGFTLVEVIVSVVLVSIVLISLMATLVRLRETYSVVHENSDVLVYANSVNRVINNDLMDNNGIRYVTCDTSGTTCDLILGNDKKRRLEIDEDNIHHGKTVVNKINANNEVEHITKRTTLKYTDTTKETVDNNGVVDESKNSIVYIRTLTLEDYVDKNGVHTTEGYNFYNITSELKEYGDNNNYVDVVTNITINIYDGIDINDTRYNIQLYTTCKYDYKEWTGKRYKIEFDLNGATYGGTTTMDEVFGVG